MLVFQARDFDIVAIGLCFKGSQIVDKAEIGILQPLLFPVVELLFPFRSEMLPPITGLTFSHKTFGIGFNAKGFIALLEVKRKTWN